ncbi:Zinc knuckle CX2CX4HX4C [Parasponia andersonii]|uniref:Zinc knuckle CX2CX4HX4C n=1 Tax=Parasponia andersonii TaxID=3476 RepID=A0A2P5CMQ9_PARAD|nr:Zinc knuckle CX2CX4HX4C [Parasponia andersonii]
MTLKSEFGHFTRILIGMDLSQPISDSLMVEVGNDCFFIPLEYERLPDFCFTCQTISYATSFCRCGHKIGAAIEDDCKITRRCSRICKHVYRHPTKSSKTIEIPTQVVLSNISFTKTLITNSKEMPIKNSISLMVNTLRINNEVEPEKGKKKIHNSDDISKTKSLSQNLLVVANSDDSKNFIHSTDSSGKLSGSKTT